MADKTQKQMIQETHQTVTQISTVLLGIPGTADNGVVGQVKSNTKSISKLKVTLAAIVGTGVLGTGIWQLVGLING